MAYFNGKELLLAGLKGPKGDPGLTPYIGPNGNWWTGTTDTGVLAGGISEEEKQTINNRLTNMEQTLADHLYAQNPFSITSFSISGYTTIEDGAKSGSNVEIGSTVTNVTLAWAFSRDPKTVTLNNDPQTATKTASESLPVNIKLDKPGNERWTLKAIDERGTEVTKSADLYFVNGVYYGVAEQPAQIDDAFIKSLTRTLRSSKLTSFNANVTSGKYLWYCLPAGYGTCAFSLGVLPGGVSLIDTIRFENASGYVESYYIYRSDYAGLGNKTVTVK